MKIINSVKVKHVSKNKKESELSSSSLNIAATKLEATLKKRTRDKNTPEEFTEWK